MNRTCWLLLLGVLPWGNPSPLLADPGPSGASRFGKPNLVFIVADDLGYGELGCQGNPQIPTPHIDALAHSGVRFTSGYVTAPNCSPSRAGLMVGQFPTRFGHEFNPIGAKNEDPSYGLPVRESTIADALQNSGYITGIVGKWHLGGAAPYHPHRRGFDEFYGFTHEGHYYVPDPWKGVTTMLRRRELPGGGQGRRRFDHVVYDTHMGYNEPDYDANNPIIRGSQPVTEATYLTDAWTREAVDFIGRHRDKPFFLYVAHNAVHSPLQASNACLQEFTHIDDVQRRIFAAMLRSLDNSIGAVIERIRSEGLEHDTLIVFLSDNGGPTRELTSSNLPLRGEKGQVYEGGIRVPFMMAWPGKLPAGKVYHQPVSSVDLYATSLAIAGSQQDLNSDGVNLMPYLLGKESGRPHHVLYWRQGSKSAVRVGDWKLVRHGRKKPGPWELYNLANDLPESRNLATKEPGKLQDMVSAWNQLNAEMVPPAFK